MIKRWGTGGAGLLGGGGRSFLEALLVGGAVADWGSVSLLLLMFEALRALGLGFGVDVAWPLLLGGAVVVEAAEDGGDGELLPLLSLLSLLADWVGTSRLLRSGGALPPPPPTAVLAPAGTFFEKDDGGDGFLGRLGILPEGEEPGNTSATPPGRLASGVDTLFTKYGVADGGPHLDFGRALAVVEVVVDGH